MTPERWHLIKAICQAARAHQPDTRVAFLAEACHGDATLRRDVDSLLAADWNVETADPRPATSFASASENQPLSPGTMIGAYRLEELIGGGGQARVYRARDTQINKVVAIKVLPDGWLTPNRRARFDREAHALAALNDPHIGAIYGLATDGHRRGLVLEYVDGPTLGQELAQHAAQSPQTGLPIVRALTIARQIALALEAAHEKGIVHRDLKPANIKTSETGVVKVLDFGIAKLGDAASDDASPDTPTITYEGVVIGTAGYMSPEQARGKAVDRRTDVWAFGCLLYEMLTGRRAFDGETVTDTLAAVVHLDVNWAALPPGTPDVIRRLLMRCLQKDVQSRLRDIADARYEVDEALAEIAGTGTRILAAGPAPVRRNHWLIGGAIVIAIAGLIIAGVAVRQWFEAGPSGPDNFRHQQLTTLPGEEIGSQLSPDGQWVAFRSRRAGTTQLFVQPVNGDGVARPVTLPRGLVSMQVWSPDGNQLACLVWDGDAPSIHIVPAFYGGVPRQTIPLAAKSIQALIRWVGRSLFIAIKTGSDLVLHRIDLDTGSLVSLSDKWNVPGRLDMFDVRPDGRLVVFRVFQNSQEDLWIAGIDGTAARRLTNGSDFERYPLWSTRGEHIVFQSNREGQIDLWEITLASGQVRRLTTSPELEAPESTTQDGSVSYRRTAEDAHLWTWDLDGNAQQLTQDARSDLSPAYAPEGRLLVFQRSQSSSPERLRTTGYKLFAGQLNGPGFSRDPEPLWDGFAPRPSPNGLWLAYLQRAGERTRLLVTEIATTQSKVVSSTSPGPFWRDFPLDLVYQNVAWHPKGTELYFVDQPGESVHILRRYRLHASDAESFPSTRTSETMTDVYALADGRTVSYLTRSADSCSLHLFDVTAGTDDVRTHFPCSRFVTMRGWTRIDAAAVIVRPLTLNDDTTHAVEVMLVPAKGTPSRVKSFDRVFISSVRFDPERSLLYMTRSEEGIHNMHALSLQSWKLLSVTRNRNPDVTFTGVEPLGSGLVIGSRHERKSDVWLLEPRSSTGGTPSASGTR